MSDRPTFGPDILSQHSDRRVQNLQARRTSEPSKVGDYIGNCIAINGSVNYLFKGDRLPYLPIFGQNSNNG